MIRGLRAVVAAVSFLVAAPAPDPLANLFGARLGIARAEVRTLAPAVCVREAGGESEKLRGADGGAARLPSVDAGCLPRRSVVLTDPAGPHGLIVQEQDPRIRIAGLTR